MQPTIKSHIDFCKSVANGSTFKDAYLMQVSCKNGTSEATAEQQGSRLAKKYAIYIQELKQKTSMAIDKAYENEAVKDALKSVISKTERMQVLSDIAIGKLKISKPIFTKEGVIDSYVEPDCNDRTKAIAELNKMDGAYAPQKIDNTIKGSLGVNEVTYEQAKEIQKKLDEQV